MDKDVYFWATTSGCDQSKTSHIDYALIIRSSL